MGTGTSYLWVLVLPIAPGLGLIPAYHRPTRTHTHKHEEETGGREGEERRKEEIPILSCYPRSTELETLR